MLVIFFVVFLSVFLVFFLYLGMFVISVKDGSVFKVFSFESGFMSVGKVRSAFSVHFFLMMLMFVVFDLEIVMLLGLLVSDLSAIGVLFVVSFFCCGWIFYGVMLWYVGLGY
uniref:NADH-ubiquinone oxidoreductase chain 3 n=1 Tax=Aspiculuris tetraptera TaxID=451377 RepID=A0A141HAU2_9BILA|nr:NADH dehydrogenase subunit 3 [Aspiculuris tetraptera]